MLRAAARARLLRLTRLLALPAGLLLLLAPIHADNQLRSVQEELRRRNLYFGNIDGRASGEVDEAARRYQQRKGLPQAGPKDPETLRSLGLLERRAGEVPPKELEYPEEPVLKSDETINVVIASKELSRETGVEPVSVVGEKLPERREASGAERRARARALAAAQRVSSRNRSVSRSSRQDSRIEPAEMTKFARDFLKAMSRNDLRGELRFYAERLDYHNNRQIDRRLVEHSLRRYYQRWPSRSYKIGETIDYSVLPGTAEIVLTFSVNFSLKGHGQKVKGRTLNQLVINGATSDPRIVSISERRLPR